jgi:hypothetical protein
MSEDELRTDPLGVLSEAAGYDDSELWWEQQVEARQDSAGLFEAILEAMTAVRDEHPETSARGLLREAWMRKVIRQTVKAGHEHIAVVCGAWHAPALAKMPPVKHDTALLKGLPKSKVSSTWIPWTNSRLSYRSGYGAGVESPGWYRHLWEEPKNATTRWMTLAGRLLRAEDLDASSASVIEAVRLADALASMRDVASPGLRELREAIQTVLCHGNGAPMQLIRSKLEIGEKLGEVPEGADAVPLQRDLAAEQKRLRLKPTAEIKEVSLDLRKSNDLDRSKLLHRLCALGIAWGERARGKRSTGTFRETWTIQWKPELHIELIEANLWGNTVKGAASAKFGAEAKKAELDDLTVLLDAAILSDLPDAVQTLLSELQDRAAVSSDVLKMMKAVGPLAEVARYSDVRKTEASQVMPILRSLFARALVGLPHACAQADDEAALELVAGINSMHSAAQLVDIESLSNDWVVALESLQSQDAAHGLLRGRACRLLIELQVLSEDEVGKQASLALSAATNAMEAGSWIQGLLTGSGLLLIHQRPVWIALDTWLRDLDGEAFNSVLPLVRRGFADFSGAERRTMGEKVKDLNPASASSTATTQTQDTQINHDRAEETLSVLQQILGA